MQEVVSSHSTTRSILTRIRIKAIGLFGRAAIPAKSSGCHIILQAECPACEGLEERLVAIERKLDILIEVLLKSDSPPKWHQQTEVRLLEAIGEIVGEYAQVSSDRDRFEGELRDLADGADRFLAGLRQKLTKEQADLFFELIASGPASEGRRARTYAEIGARLGISKQAVQQRFRRMAQKNPSVADYINAIRHPEKPRLFSELSPRVRRAIGAEGSYDHNTE